jgi:GT2 family glycosyltransferase
MKQCNITVGIPTFQRPEKLINTLNKILNCDPQPNEIIIHIDGQDLLTEEHIKELFQDIKIIRSNSRVGPGGGRNKIITEASNSIIASFDDDSYPLDRDYFQRIKTLFEHFPKMSVVGATIYEGKQPVHEINQLVDSEQLATMWTSSFIGCGCAYRKEAVIYTQGYVPLPIAYGMEEVDLSLQLHHHGWGILKTSWLRVFHDTGLEHRNKPQVTAASISNQALLTYLRYPWLFWWIGFGQSINRIIWLILNKKWAGIIAGVIQIPQLIWENRSYRYVVSSDSLLSYLRLSRHPVEIDLSQFEKIVVQPGSLNDLKLKNGD